jgi:hypothetical protein
MEHKKKNKIVNIGSFGVQDIKPTHQDTRNRYGIERWKVFGADNLWPQAVAYLNRKSNVHRSIINKKTLYITGRGFTTENKELENYIKNVNADGEHLREVFRKLNFDDQSNGNSWLEAVTNSKGQFLNFYHHDFTTCRLGHKDDLGYVLIHGDWAKVNHTKEKIKRIPLYPNMEDTLDDGNLRSMIHFKDYEPEFVDYGMPQWIAGMDVSAIAYKTDKWNISRLDNNFNGSGVLLVEGEFEDDTEAEDLKSEFKKEFTGDGNTGKIMFIAKNQGGEHTQFIPFNGNSDSDWDKLHTQSTGDIVIAHGWYRSLSGISDNTGFDTDRILNEYNIALQEVILDRQEYFMSKIKTLITNHLRIPTDDLDVINKPPITAKPDYMKVWEARKADGLDYDEEDQAQNVYIANLKTTKPAINGQ